MQDKTSKIQTTRCRRNSSNFPVAQPLLCPKDAAFFGHIHTTHQSAREWLPKGDSNA